MNRTASKNKTWQVQCKVVNYSDAYWEKQHGTASIYIISFLKLQREKDLTVYI